MATDTDKELQEIAQAPPVPSAGLAGRCHFCGAVTRELVPVHDYLTINGVDKIVNERYRGVDCCGGMYGH